NVLNSFIDTAAAFEYSLIAACPNGFKPDAKTVENALTKGAIIEITEDANIAAKGADCVVTDTWVSMGDENVSQRMQAFAPYQVNEELMAKANARAIFLHCLPAHRGDEVTNAVMDGANSLVFAEAENRIHAQKAILRWCLEK
ncbi:MAG: ornithine carbamoyltransferase, partial [Pseudomonadota bacterium]